jgi:hypothetical protein
MPPHRHRIAACLLAAATAAAACGCSVRDERAAGGADSAWWASAAGERRTGLIAESPAHAPAATAIEYVDNLEAGRRRASETGLPMLVVFRASWCRWSGDLLKAVAGDPRIVSLSRRYVCVAVDADRHAADCDRCSVRAFPTVVILDPAGNERFRGTGSSAIGPLASAMADVLTAPGSPRRIAGGEQRSRR